MGLVHEFEHEIEGFNPTDVPRGGMQFVTVLGCRVPLSPIFHFFSGFAKIFRFPIFQF